MPFDPTLILLVVLIAAMGFFMFRNSKKRQQAAQQLQEQLVPGVEVMTSHGIYGTLLSLDLEKNEALVETTPGVQLRLHSQTISRVIEPEEPALEEPEAEAEEPGSPRRGLILNGEPVDEPEFGERSDEPRPKRKPRGTSAE